MTVNRQQFNSLWSELHKIVTTDGNLPISKNLSDALASKVKAYFYPAGKAKIAIGNITINENAGTVIIPVERYGGIDMSVSVKYNTSNVTAIAGVDYEGKSGTISWADGEAGTKNISINILDDLIFENNEVRTFKVSIHTPVGFSLGTPISVVIGIKDDEVFVPPQPSGKLLNRSNMNYLGAFRVPGDYTATDGLSWWGGTTIALKKETNSLLINTNKNGIAEISIVPELIAPTANLNQATLLKTFTQVVDKLQNTLDGAADGAPIGGFVIHNGKIICSQYAYYSGAGSQALTHFVLDSLDIYTANITGLFQAGDGLGWARKIAGYMCEIPVEYQQELGGTHLTGLCYVPITATSSSGPSVFVFNPDNLGSTPIPATPLVYYPADHQLGEFSDTINPIGSGSCGIGSVLFVPETDSVLFFGKAGVNYTGYGTPDAFGDFVSDGGTGPQCLNGQYHVQVWAYDIKELIKVKNGEKQPWEVKPYNVWDLNELLPYDMSNPQGFSRFNVAGATFDKEANKLYLSVKNVDHVEPYSSLPLIHVFSFDKNVVEIGPKVGTLCVTPQTLVPGPIAIGTSIDFVAGNVYAKTNKVIVSVEFFLDGSSIGNGVLYPINNYKLTFNSSSLSVGQHQIKAKAVDSDGLYHEKSINFNMIVPTPVI